MGFECLDQFPGRANRSKRVVLVRDWESERADDRVSERLIDCGSISLEHLAHGLARTRKTMYRHLRIKPPRQRQPGEENGHVPAKRRLGEHSMRDAGR